MIYEIISLALLGAVIIYTSKVMYDVEKSYNSLLEAYKDANRKLEYMVKLKDGTLQPLEEYEAENPPTETRTMHNKKGK